MGKFSSKRNFGYGKQMSWAGHEALNERYGGGHDSTVATHSQHWKLFCKYVREMDGINDASKIDLPLLERYAEHLRERVIDEVTEVAYAQNLLSGVNVTLESLRKDRKIRIDSPSEWVGRRDTVRRDVPTGYEWGVIEALRAHLVTNGFERAAIVLQFARRFGVRLRESVLADLKKWQKQARVKGAIDIRLGTKGGRGKEVERWIKVDQAGMKVIDDAIATCARLGCGGNLLRPDETFDGLVNDGEMNSARRHLHAFGVKGYHDLRAAWACERYQQITGILAPVFQPEAAASHEVDREARKTLAPELGHDRIDVVAEYVGAR